MASIEQMDAFVRCYAKLLKEDSKNKKHNVGDKEKHYQKPMDIEWAKDGITNELFIIQARPETVHSQKNPLLVKEYKLLDKAEAITEGEAIGSKIATGTARPGNPGRRRWPRPD